MEAVDEGVVAVADATDLLLIAAVWVNPRAADERRVFENNKEATLIALRAGKEGRPSVGDALAGRHAPFNAYFSGS
jgi:formaldehyde-activating enzyme